MRIAVLGGSFNPPHIGHLALADDVCRSLGYDRILFVPAYMPPHKELADAATAYDRLAMVQAAVSGDSRFAAESAEIDRGGVSYTYDTLCELQKKYADCLEGKLGLVMGSDLAAEFHLWHRAADIALTADLILAERPLFAEDVPGERTQSAANKPAGGYCVPHTGEQTAVAFGFSHLTVQNPVLPVSSTQVRARIVQGKSWRYLVPDPVYRYIVSRNLYGYTETD